MNRALPALLLMTACLSAPACTPTYPKEKLELSIRELFKKEVQTEDVRVRVAGKTLYVSFQIDNMVSATLDLPKEVTERLENAMLSLTRVAMSTDEKIDFIVLDARDDAWGVQTTFIRRTEDLRFLYYMTISKGDFDERFILETRRFDPKTELPEDGWTGLTLQEYMGRWVAFRLGLGAQTNPFTAALLGVKRVTSAYDAAKQTVTLTLESDEDEDSETGTKLRAQFLKDAALEQMKKVESKYLSRLPSKEGWAQTLDVRDEKGGTLFTALRDEWLKK
ncbi:MAG: hypothetical protein A2901_01365 [Elusimicrobia bacterium RIFCSPLOWO2_01_FULL_54_10]|nr:MAG: hypothetical protein A2901_01365 [Elusimicrobia bacterium RIFCSPLOWO2_01_FULL_54_10]